MKRISASMLVLALFSGCGVIDALWPFGPFGRETGSPELKAFESEQELTDYMAAQISARNSGFGDLDRNAVLGDVSFDASPGDSSDAALDGDGGQNPPSPQNPDRGESGTDDDYSQTTTQETGVDEADVVKTDGTYVYIIDNEYPDSVLRIVKVSPPEEIALVSVTPLEGSGREIYLHDGKIVALTSTGGGFFILEAGDTDGGSTGSGDVVEGQGEPTDSTNATDGDTADDNGEVKPSQADATNGMTPDSDMPGFVGSYEYERPKTKVTILDVAAPDEPVTLSQTKFDGTTTSSRMIDGVLHLVLANYQNYYYDMLPALGRSDLDVSAIDSADLLPTVTRTGANGSETSEPMVTWQELYHPTDPDGFGVVTVVSLDVDAGANFTAVGIVAEPGLIYSSLSALYLTDTEYTFDQVTRETTDIYKLAYVDRGAVPTATGSVPGRVLNQYSMGEYDGNLRVATTVSSSPSFFGGRQTSNNVYVLSPSDTTLGIVGRIENIAPGETIRAARFMGDRGYVVTAVNVDPLFTLDLSDPTDPWIVGELKIPGFSTFLVPMDEDHLLAVGRHIPTEGPFFSWGVQLSIFDVSDFANPQRTANVILGEVGGADSEALSNPKAFTYFTQRGLVALPLTMYESSVFLGGGGSFVDDMIDNGVVDVAQNGEDTTSSTDVEQAPPPDGADEAVDSEESFIQEGFQGLVVFQVTPDEGIVELGRISTQIEDAGIFWSAFTRGVFIGDDVFAVTDSSVRGASIADIESVPYKLVFDR